MSIHYYVLSAEREQLRDEAVNRAVRSLQGPVIVYERLPGLAPKLTVTEKARATFAGSPLVLRCGDSYVSQVLRSS